jgi:hypothetical protein
MTTRATDDAPLKEYFATIEDEFVRLRGAPLVLSPAEWHLAATWHRLGIPLSVVLVALRHVMEKAAEQSRRRPVLSLSYCRHEVEAEFGRFLESSAGDTTHASEPEGPTAAQRLERKATELESRSRESSQMLGLADAAIAALRQAGGELQAGRAHKEKLEKQLMTQERALLDSLEQTLQPEDREDLVNGCRERLQPYRQRMAEDVYVSTLRHACDAALRRRFKIPRLSLLTD